MSNLVKTDPWVEALLVDPISKGKLVFDNQQGKIISNYGSTYSITEGVYDFRPYQAHVSQDALTWVNGQEEFESSGKELITSDNDTDYKQEIKGVSDVYEQMPIKGRCLDVGGHQGRLRAFLRDENEYLIVDPFLDAFEGIEKRGALLKAYPFLQDKVNFIGGVSEHLPLRSCSFDTVHMRSVIDHFQNPELALLEAYRVLRKDGQLIVGLYVEGGASGKVPFSEKAKEAVKKVLHFSGINRWVDHHVWHPTHAELEALIKRSGFIITQTYWQKSHKDKVCYILAVKSS